MRKRQARLTMIAEALGFNFEIDAGVLEGWITNGTKDRSLSKFAYSGTLNFWSVRYRVGGGPFR